MRMKYLVLLQVHYQIFKNPYESGEAAVENASGTVVGVTYIQDDGTTITITTKTKNSTESKFNLSNTVKVE